MILTNENVCYQNQQIEYGRKIVAYIEEYRSFAQTADKNENRLMCLFEFRAKIFLGSEERLLAVMNLPFYI